MKAKLHEVKAEIQRRRHLSIPDQGRWLAAVLRGHCAYYGVPTNYYALDAFRSSSGSALASFAVATEPEVALQLEADESDYRSLATFCNHRSSPAEPTLPRHYPRQDPSAVIPPAGICAGGGPSPKARAVPTATFGDSRKAVSTGLALTQWLRLRRAPRCTRTRRVLPPGSPLARAPLPGKSHLARGKTSSPSRR
jgi:hypothetical protein